MAWIGSERTAGHQGVGGGHPASERGVVLPSEGEAAPESEAAHTGRIGSPRQKWWCLPRACALTISSLETHLFRKGRLLFSAGEWRPTASSVGIDDKGMVRVRPCVCGRLARVPVRRAWLCSEWWNTSHGCHEDWAGGRTLIYAHSLVNKLCRNEPHGAGATCWLIFCFSFLNENLKPQCECVDVKKKKEGKSIVSLCVQSSSA